MMDNEYLSDSEMALSVAPTAAERSGTESPIPVTPETIAMQVVDCAEIGATIAAIHGWTEDGNPSTDALPAVAEAIRTRTTDVLVEYAVGPECQLGDYLDAIDAGPRPELAQIRITPTQYGRRGATRRTRDEVDRFIDELRDRDIKPNLLIQSGRDVQELHRLLEANTVSDPVVTVKLGARDGTVATPRMLLALLDSLPSAANTLVAATGPNQYPLTTQAVFLGAGVRTGMGDNRYLGYKRRVGHNRQLVQRVSETVSHSERSLADRSTVESEFGLEPTPFVPDEVQ
jgi:3-keto-5-aminohexanoate cleavage enzyme